MSIRTQQSLTGFIASEPQLTFTTEGDARFYARIGQEHFRRNGDGSFTKVDTTFHDLVQYRRAAERAYAAFAKGDRFVAEGYVRTYEQQVEGQAQSREEFVAKKLGHDVARTSYAVDRTRRPATAEQDHAAETATHEPAGASAAPPSRGTSPMSL